MTKKNDVRATLPAASGVFCESPSWGRPAEGQLTVSADDMKLGIAVDTACGHITPAVGNVFVDLGFPKDEAEQLKAESMRRICKQGAR